jgi:hypothetical protein
MDILPKSPILFPKLLMEPLFEASTCRVERGWPGMRNFATDDFFEVHLEKDKLFFDLDGAHLGSITPFAGSRKCKLPRCAMDIRICSMR